MSDLRAKETETGIRRKGSSGPNRAEYIVFAVIAAVCFLLFNHPDIMETARHGYILIQSTLDGNFLQFFENTLSRSYGYAYVNAAHYNILMYILYALWELPLYLIEQIGGFAFDDVVLAMWSKWIGVAFYLGCGILVKRLAEKIGCSRNACQWAPMLFWLNPIAFFNTMVMGQYDSICLFFTLWAMLLYFEKRYTAFSLMMGVGFVFKFFPLFLFIPMLLLVEKRPLRLLRYGVISLWLYLPTTLLFLGRNGDAGLFNQMMAERLFAVKVPGGLMDVSCFGLVMVIICIAAYLYRPATRQNWQNTVVYGSMAVFSALFFFVLWHPQWMILLVPMLLLSILQQREQTNGFYLSLALSIGFFLLTASLYPRALEGNMLDWGILRPITGWFYTVAEQPRWNDFYFALIPYLNQLAPILFYGALLGSVIFQLPLHGQSLGDRISDDSMPKFSYRLVCWGSFAVAFCGFWLVPTLFSYGKTVGLL